MQVCVLKFMYINWGPFTFHLLLFTNVATKYLTCYFPPNTYISVWGGNSAPLYIYPSVSYQFSRLIEAGVSTSPFTLSLSAVLRKAGNCSCETFTSPAYINSNIACKWV